MKQQTSALSLRVLFLVFALQPLSAESQTDSSEQSRSDLRYNGEPVRRAQVVDAPGITPGDPRPRSRRSFYQVDPTVPRPSKYPAESAKPEISILPPPAKPTLRNVTIPKPKTPDAASRPFRSPTIPRPTPVPRTSPPQGSFSAPISPRSTPAPISSPPQSTPRAPSLIPVPRTSPSPTQEIRATELDDINALYEAHQLETTDPPLIYRDQNQLLWLVNPVPSTESSSPRYAVTSLRGPIQPPFLYLSFQGDSFYKQSADLEDSQILPKAMNTLGHSESKIRIIRDIEKEVSLAPKNRVSLEEAPRAMKSFFGFSKNGRYQLLLGIFPFGFLFFFLILLKSGSTRVSTH